MRKVVIILLVVAATLFLSACAEEERVNPEDTVKNYVDAWQSFQFDQLSDYLNQESQEALASQERTLEERMEKVYGDLGVDTIQVSYESRNFEEEEIDWEEIEELVYPIDVKMNTIAGALQYETDIVIHKIMEINEDEEEVESWQVAWHPSHIFLGLEDISDQISIDKEDPKRGEIYDRNGEPLAINGEILSVGFQPDRIEDFDKATQEAADILEMDVEKVREITTQYPNNPDWFTELQTLPLNDPRSSLLQQVKGMWVYTVPGREYPHGETLGHVIGHIGPITAEILEQREGEGYHANSILGRRGLELELEERLRGKPGVTITIKNNEGNTKHVVLKTEPENGEDIHLTIDVDVQTKLAETLGEESAGGVVMNPTTGEILALVSQPSYDSNHRYLGIKDRLTDEVEDINLLYERRFQQAYSPGSIFKPFTAIIGIEEGTLDPAEVIQIQDRTWKPDESWGSHYITRVNSNPEVDLNVAMMESDNIYFAQQALRIGNDRMEEWAKTLGFGETFPFGFPLVSSSIANDGLNAEVLLADTGYGQGEVQVSPVHISALYTMFLNEGNIIQPTLFKDEATEVAWKNNVVSPDTVNTVLDTMISVVENQQGTAYRSSPGHSRAIAGKTGTAELKQSRSEEDGEQLGWYVALDYETKDLLVAVMMQHVEGRGGSGLVVDKVNEFISKIE